MRKIEEEMVAAVKERRPFKKQNTEVRVSGNMVYVTLHGSMIWRMTGNVARFCLQGWNTQTTRSRLNALGVGIRSKNRQPVVKGEPVNDYTWHLTRPVR